MLFLLLLSIDFCVVVTTAVTWCGKACVLFLFLLLQRLQLVAALLNHLATFRSGEVVLLVKLLVLVVILLVIGRCYGGRAIGYRGEGGGGSGGGCRAVELSFPLVVRLLLLSLKLLLIR